MSAITCTAEFMNFAHYFRIYKQAEKRRNDMNCNAATDAAVKESQGKFEQAVSTAMNKLFRLDTMFFKETGEHVVVKLNNFGEYLEVLQNIENAVNEKEKSA